MSTALRVVVVSAGQRWPQWACLMVEAVLALPGAQWQGWLLAPQVAAPTTRTQRWYAALEQRLMPVPRPPDQLRAAPQPAPAPQLADWRVSAGAVPVPAATVDQWEAEQVDLVIWLLPCVPRFERAPRLARGVWSLLLDQLCATDPMAGAASVCHAPHLVETRLVDWASTPPRQLYRSVGAAFTNSLGGTRRRALYKGQAFMARCLRDGAQRPQQLEREERVTAPTPGGGALLCAVVGAVAGNRWRRQRLLDQWQIAFTFDAAPGWHELERFQPLLPPPDRFWADPMPLFWQGRHWIVFEELVYAENKGRLMAQEVSPAGPVGPVLPVMEQPYHLSYPFLVEEGGKLYMIPESQRARSVVLYECVAFPGQWRPVATLLEQVKAVDATVHRGADGRWWMWVSVVHEEAECGEELNVYFADALQGPWQAHPANPVVSDIRCARPGGPLIETPQGLLRPAQNSGQAYGHHIEWRLIDTLTPSAYHEQPAGVLAAPPGASWQRIHTVAEAHGLRVVDLMAARARR